MQHAERAKLELFDASTWRIGLVVALFNQQVTSLLHRSALDRAAAYKIAPENIDTITVAGAVEIPLALQIMAETGQYDALLAIGCVIQGATPHFDYVCKLVTEGILRVQLDYSMPVGFGVLTCATLAQAEERSQLGGDHLDAVLQLAKATQPQGW